MRDYRENMFYIPIAHIEVRNWKQKKDKLLEFHQEVDLKSDKNGKVLTNFHIDATRFNEVAESLFDEELSAFLDKVDIGKRKITESWFETSESGNYHPVHTHGCYGYSSVCYIQYDKQEHEPTVFVSPFLNFLDGNVLEYSPNVDEGSIIFFPSSIIHYTKPNKSEKERIIFSFNLS